MKDITEKNFGMLISFSLPGFILLYSLSFSFPELKEWLAGTAAKDSLSVGDFLYSALASLVGVFRYHRHIVSCWPQLFQDVLRASRRSYERKDDK